MNVKKMGPDLNFQENGYLFLAGNEQQAKMLRANHDIQMRCGADVVLLDAQELICAFPHLNVDDICLASYGRSGEGWFSNTGLMDAFRQKARHLGAELINGEVVAIQLANSRVTGIVLKDGERIDCNYLVNACGTRAAGVAAMAGLQLPVEPRRRMLFVFDCTNTPQGSATVNHGRLPLMIDKSGLFCRPEGTYFLTGMAPEIDHAVDPEDFAPRHQEFEVIWSKLALRSRYFEAIKLVNWWVGHYDYNTLDQNAIVGPHSEIGNFLFANGFTGHGLQQSPAVGRGLSELITYGEYRTLNLSELGYTRVLQNKPFIESEIIS